MPTATKPATQVRTALWVRLDAKPGQEAALAEFLEAGLPLVEQEPATVSWYAVRPARPASWSPTPPGFHFVRPWPTPSSRPSS